MSTSTPFGHPIRTHFQFSPNYVPLNHGSFGTFPIPVRSTLEQYRTLMESRPDTFIRYTYPPLLHEGRKAIASLVNVDADEIVFVPNATLGINTVLRGMKFEEGDVIVYFETVYGAVEKTVDYVVETTKVEKEMVEAHWPIDDTELVKRFEATVRKINEEGNGKRRVRLAIFDTIVSMPGVRVPFEQLAAKCKQLGVLSMTDGAHGIGHIPLDLGKLQPDFFVSNLHKWLFLPRGLAALYIPLRSQPLIRSSLPTSHGFIPLHPSSRESPLPASAQPPFIAQFEFVGTIDNTNYLCVPSALQFRQDICGGEEAIMQYCIDLARKGGDRAAEILGTEVLDNATGSMRNCAFANVRLPLEIGEGQGMVRESEAGKVGLWIAERAVEEFETFLAAAFYQGHWWWRVSAQVYLELKDIEWGAGVIKELCERVRTGEWSEKAKARL
ncbi:hypothetical protein MMC30_002978 [Trapelia coarctata]|nr:hypothetical protein [Trapelia coarctata]